MIREAERLAKQIYKIEIPEKAMEQSQFVTNQPLAMNISHKQIIIRPAHVMDQLPNIKFWWYFGPAFILTIAMLAFGQHQHLTTVPIIGDYSIANASMFASLVSGLTVFVISFIFNKVKKKGPTQDVHWRNLPTITIAIGLIIVFSFSAFFWLFEQLFMDARFDLYTSTMFILLIISAVNYLMINLSLTLSSGIITNLLTFMIIGGMLFSMLTNSDHNWWKHNFSFLGTAHNSANLQFNVTLIFSGLLMMALVDYLFVNLHRRYHGRGIIALRLLLYAQALCIAAIGCFPNNPEFHVLHDRISMWLVYIMLILIVAIRWILPEVTKQFLEISYVMGGLMGFNYVVFKLSDYLSLTAFELLEFGLAFSWILLLFQNIENLAQFGQNLFIIKILNDQSTAQATDDCD